MDESDNNLCDTRKEGQYASPGSAFSKGTILDCHWYRL